MRFASPAFVVVMLLGAMMTSCAARTRPSAPVATPEGVRFTLVRPEAQRVALAGTFNQWSASAHPMSRQGPSGVWTVAVPLPPGEHLFMFVIDSRQWITPPLADDFVDDGFGARNGVVVVRPTETPTEK